MMIIFGYLWDLIVAVLQTIPVVLFLIMVVYEVLLPKILRRLSADDAVLAGDWPAGVNPREVEVYVSPRFCDLFGASAQTIGDGRIVLRDAPSRSISHECGHLADAAVWGPLWPLVYAAAYLIDGRSWSTCRFEGRAEVNRIGVAHGVLEYRDNGREVVWAKAQIG